MLRPSAARGRLSPASSQFRINEGSASRAAQRRKAMLARTEAQASRWQPRTRTAGHTHKWALRARGWHPSQQAGRASRAADRRFGQDHLVRESLVRQRGSLMALLVFTFSAFRVVSKKGGRA